jgi:hypothetical protein
VTPPTSDDRFSIAVFPFLKTTDRIRISGIEFRSTTDVGGLPSDQATAVGEVAKMLYLKDEDRLETATFAVVPYVALDRGKPDTTLLERIHAVVAYLYATPDDLRGSPFLTTEHSSLVIFTPGEVPVSLVGRYGMAEDTGELVGRAGDERHHVRGYTGLYNFRHHFWVAPGSRLYGPAPHMTLNLSQDISHDLDCRTTQPHVAALLRLPEKQQTSGSSRVLTALKWFNSASSEAVSETVAIVHLAIAVETLLGLPQSEKTDRIVDSIALLLGRVPRLDVWAQQFYAARSAVVHEGDTPSLRFVVADSRKVTTGPEYQSLLAYGRQVFRLCLAALVTGAELAEQAGLADRFVPNHERFNTLCRVLSDSQLPACETLERAAPLIDAIDRYRFVGDPGLRLGSMLGATRLAAVALLACETNLESDMKTAIELLTQTGKEDELAQLEALRMLEALLPEAGSDSPSPPREVLRRLVKIVWGSVFMHYFWLKDRQESRST